MLSRQQIFAARRPYDAHAPKSRNGTLEWLTVAGAKRTRPTPLTVGAGRVDCTCHVVPVSVAVLLLVSITLFLPGAPQGASIVVQTWADASQHGELSSINFAAKFLAVIGVMLRAVVMDVIGVGLYSLFIKPLNLTAALDVDPWWIWKRNCSALSVG